MAEQFCHWCGKDLVGKRSHAKFCDSSCRGKYTLWKQGRSGDDEKALESASPPPIQVIREGQEAETERWATVVDEAIRQYFRDNPGEIFHADDIEHLGVPDEYRKSVVGSQVAKWVNRKWMVGVGYRRSAIPSRNGAKSQEYRLTDAGRKVIAGDGADSATRPSREARGVGVNPDISVVSGDSRPHQPVSGAGVPSPQGSGGALLSVPCCASTAPPDSVAEELEEAEGALFGEPVPLAASSAFNPDNEFA